jgi:hypothetical protein
VGRAASARWAVLTAGSAVLAACSSGPGVSAQAQAARAAVLPAARQLRTQLVSPGAGWTAAIIGDYDPCGLQDPLASGKGSGMLQYAASELMTPFGRTVPFTVFIRRVAEALDAAGWKLSPMPAAVGYTGRRDGFDLYVKPADQASLGPTADLSISGACFNAGSSASRYIGPGPRDDLLQPRPTSTPTSRYP